MRPGLDDELGDVVNLDPDGFLQTRRHEDLGRAPWSCIDPRAERGSGTNARTDPVDPGDEDVIPAVLGGVVRAPVPVDAPVAGEEGGDAGGAGAVGVAVEEGEVGGNEVGTLLNPDGELAREVGLSAWDIWKQVIPDKSKTRNYNDNKEVGGEKKCQIMPGMGFTSGLCRTLLCLSW